MQNQLPCVRVVTPDGQVRQVQPYLQIAEAVRQMGIQSVSPEPVIAVLNDQPVASLQQELLPGDALVLYWRLRGG